MTDEAFFLIPWPFVKLDTMGCKQVFKYAFGPGARSGSRNTAAWPRCKRHGPQKTHILVYASAASCIRIRSLRIFLYTHPQPSAGLTARRKRISLYTHPVALLHQKWRGVVVTRPLLGLVVASRGVVGEALKALENNYSMAIGLTKSLNQSVSRWYAELSDAQRCK